MRNKSPLPNYDQALALLLTEVVELGTELCPVLESTGRVLHEPVVADRDQPPFDRSAMDGFAVRADEYAAGKSWRVSGSVPAGADRSIFEPMMKAGTVMRIATGAPVPTGADTVIPIERCTVTAGSPESVVFQPSSIKPGENVHTRGSDARAGDGILEAGDTLNMARVALAAGMGRGMIRVAKHPVIGLLTTGDEVRDLHTPTESLEPQQIRNSNAPMLLSFLRTLGLSDVYHRHVPDEPEATLEAAREAAERCDLVITVGGVSAGQRDFLPGAWQSIGMRTFLHGVAIQPGKPVLAGRVEKALVLGLPGNPVSALCTAHLFAWPVIRKMSGMAEGGRLPWRPVTLAEPAKGRADRQVFRAASIDASGTARVPTWHGSGDLVHTARADGFIRLPLSDATVPAGQPIPFLPLAGGGW